MNMVFLLLFVVSLPLAAKSKRKSSSSTNTSNKSKGNNDALGAALPHVAIQVLEFDPKTLTSRAAR